VTQRNLVNFLSSMAQQPGFNAGDYLLALTTINFDISGLELYLPLLCGGTVGLVSSEIAQDGLALREQLESTVATHIQATPSTWRMLLAAGWQNKQSKLKLLCGGEALTSDLADALLARSQSVWNLYGPTETTIWSSVFQVRDKNKVYLGDPIANTTFYVLDQAMRPLPMGVPGELYIGGDGVARGYRHLPERTAEAFVADPYSHEEGARLYRTGDLVRRTSQGHLDYLGRLDNQVKIRGHRIELGEIEACGLVVFMTGGGPLTTAAKIEQASILREQLPDYMVPNRWVMLKTLPLTPNQKIDRHYLEHATIDRIEVDFGFGLNSDVVNVDVESVKRGRIDSLEKHAGSFVQPQAKTASFQPLISDLTVMVSEIVSLPISTIASNQHLGEFGFDSIRFTEFSLRLNHFFGIKIKPTVFFNYPTLNKLATYLTTTHTELTRRTQSRCANTMVQHLDMIKRGSKDHILHAPRSRKRVRQSTRMNVPLRSSVWPANFHNLVMSTNYGPSYWPVKI